MSARIDEINKLIISCHCPFKEWFSLKDRIIPILVKVINLTTLEIIETEGDDEKLLSLLLMLREKFLSISWGLSYEVTEWRDSFFIDSWQLVLFLRNRIANFKRDNWRDNWLQHSNRIERLRQDFLIALLEAQDNKNQVEYLVIKYCGYFQKLVDRDARLSLFLHDLKTDIEELNQ